MPYRIHRLTGIRGTLRWLLQTSRPVPARSDEELAAEVERNYRWNFSVNLLDSAGFMFGFSFISATTIVPLFISKLTASPLPIGIAAVIAALDEYIGSASQSDDITLLMVSRE
ncbi:MAG: hypothetical protein GQ524_01275 [Anaerolineales bacterium]|nr:hypothetical protein [Anaerolineales bacterium]